MNFENWPGVFFYCELKLISIFNCSNVVEKCITHASRPDRAILIEEVCNSTDGYVAK